MWKDPVESRYWWSKIQNQWDKLLHELGKAEEEEEVDLYLLRLHFDNKTDRELFTPAEEEEMLKLLSILMNDTIKHRELLAQVIVELEEKRKKYAS